MAYVRFNGCVPSEQRHKEVSCQDSSLNFLRPARQYLWLPQSEMGQRQQAKLKTMAVTKPFSGQRSIREQACMFVSDNGYLAHLTVLVHGQIYTFTQLLLLVGVALYLAKPGNTTVALSLMEHPPTVLWIERVLIQLLTKKANKEELLIKIKDLTIIFLLERLEAVPVLKIHVDFNVGLGHHSVSVCLRLIQVQLFGFFLNKSIVFTGDNIKLV